MRGPLLLVVLLLAACATVGTEPLPGRPPHRVAGGFRNPDAEPGHPEGWRRARFWLSRVWASTLGARRFDAPRVIVDRATLAADDPVPRIKWVGHSTLLVQLEGINVLTDPHWGVRAGMVSWVGPRRLSPPGPNALRRRLCVSSPGGIHWGRFDLSDEPLDEPPERLRVAARQRGFTPEHAWILKLGETRHW